jgi:hypothetical protein
MPKHKPVRDDFYEIIAHWALRKLRDTVIPHNQGQPLMSCPGEE